MKKELIFDHAGSRSELAAESDQQLYSRASKTGAPRI